MLPVAGDTVQRAVLHLVSGQAQVVEPAVAEEDVKGEPWAAAELVSSAAVVADTATDTDPTGPEAD